MASQPPYTDGVGQDFGIGIQGFSVPTNPGDYTNSKAALGSAFPEHGVAFSPFGRTENLLTPDQLTTRFLFGIPLYSSQKDPVTGKRAHMTPFILKEYIMRAVAQAEIYSNISIFPVQFNEKMAYDKAYYESFGYAQAEHKPILSVEMLGIVPSDGQLVYEVPLAWIENDGFTRGQINIVPLTAAFQGSGFLPPSQAAGGAAFLQILGTKTFICKYWQLNYTAGFPDGGIPIFINELIGTIASIEILRALETTNKVPSYSLGIDGISQSISTGGSGVYDSIIAQLDQKKMDLLNKIKAMFSYKIFAVTI